MSDEANMDPADEPEQQRLLPFSKWWPVVAGALVGLALRLVYVGDADGSYVAMMASFIYLVPLAVGAVTVYLAERQSRRTWGYYLAAGVGSNILFVVGTLMILIEGWICAILIIPLFAAIGMVGAVVMGVICRMTNWPKHAVYSVTVLPLLLGAIEPTDGLPMRLRTIERSVVIEAPREVVWDQLKNMRDIRAEDVEDGLAFLIGVPPPISALSDDGAGQHVRRISMGKHVYFDQVETERREHQYVRWSQRFYPDSFPPGSFDEHVVMGGEYFDIDAVSYTLAPQGQRTQLTLMMHYRVSTRFNWYAEPVARLMLGNLEEVLLGLYEQRSVAAAGG
ncbi:MAG: SRPBCC domain-containing protein [Steroidobacter sp.]